MTIGAVLAAGACVELCAVGDVAVARAAADPTVKAVPAMPVLVALACAAGALIWSVGVCPNLSGGAPAWVDDLVMAAAE